MDDTRKLLKVFGMAVTEFEAGAEKLEAVIAQLKGDTPKEDIAKLLKDTTDISFELNTRWLETTERVFATQNRLLKRCGEAAVRLQTEGE